MLLQFTHEDGRTYTVPITQASVHTDDGIPCAVVYQHSGLIVYTDAEKSDFDRVIGQLRIKRLELDG